MTGGSFCNTRYIHFFFFFVILTDGIDLRNNTRTLQSRAANRGSTAAAMFMSHAGRHRKLPLNKARLIRPRADLLSRNPRPGECSGIDVMGAAMGVGSLTGWTMYATVNV